MNKTILITGATDGIGLATAKILASKGHNLLIHGRNSEKLKNAESLLLDIVKDNGYVGSIKTYLADLSNLSAVKSLAEKISADCNSLDVLINNAGVYKISDPITTSGIDVRFIVNTIAPFLLTQKLTPLLGKSGVVLNLSSAAQSPVDLNALQGKSQLADMEAYSQSKLAITMWSESLANKNKGNGPSIIAVNPGSLLASKMVKEGFGIAGHDINIGANILVHLAVEIEASNYSGQYFDNDKGEFSSAPPDVMDIEKSEKIIEVMEEILKINL